mmetsp:Transcript_59439/g.133518  ORF Transcript_59439/g.133518 Transcript_59439/m.133518 type:complete len:216 (-) Transcript_59439:99-746(-)
MYPSRSVPYDRNSSRYCLFWKKASNSSAQSRQTSCKATIAPRAVTSFSLLKILSRRFRSSKSPSRFHLYTFGSHKLGESKFQVATATSSSRHSWRSGLFLAIRPFRAGLSCLLPPNPPRPPGLESAADDTGWRFDARLEPPASRPAKSPHLNFELHVSDDFLLELKWCHSFRGCAHCSASPGATSPWCVGGGHKAVADAEVVVYNAGGIKHLAQR